MECGPQYNSFSGPEGMAVEDAIFALGFESVDAFNEWASTADPEEVYAYADLILELLSH